MTPARFATKAIPNVTGDNLRAALRGEVEPERTVLHTDGSWRYRSIGSRVRRPSNAVDHDSQANTCAAT